MLSHLPRNIGGYDSKKRHVIHSDGIRKTYRLRRLKCKSCRKTHVELPDFITPNKHHSCAVVEAELDGTGNDCPADDSTIRLWRKQFARNLRQIEGALRSLWSTEYRRYYPLLSADSLLEAIKNKGSGWLTTVNQILINAGSLVPTQFAFCP